MVIWGAGARVRQPFAFVAIGGGGVGGSDQSAPASEIRPELNRISGYTLRNPGFVASGAVITF